MKEIMAKAKIKTSHKINRLDYSGINKYQIEINNKKQDFITLPGEFDDNILDSEVFDFFNLKAMIISCVLALEENNPHYGCPYVEIDWENIKVKYKSKISCEKSFMQVEDYIGIRDHLNIVSTRIINYDDISPVLDKEVNEFFLIESFFLGLKSTNSRSKYFHFFVIIEFYENSREFKEMFKESLFSDDEKGKIQELISLFSNDRKKNVFKNMLNITSKSRAEKLCEFLKGKNIFSDDDNILNSSNIKDIIDQRNKLFHSSSSFDEAILYLKLFPLVKVLIKGILYN